MLAWLSSRSITCAITLCFSTQTHESIQNYGGVVLDIGYLYKQNISKGLKSSPT